MFFSFAGNMFSLRRGLLRLKETSHRAPRLFGRPWDRSRGPTEIYLGQFHQRWCSHRAWSHIPTHAAAMFVTSAPLLVVDTAGWYSHYSPMGGYLGTQNDRPLWSGVIWDLLVISSMARQSAIYFNGFPSKLNLRRMDDVLSQTCWRPEGRFNWLGSRIASFSVDWSSRSMVDTLEGYVATKHGVWKNGGETTLKFSGLA